MSTAIQPSNSSTPADKHIDRPAGGPDQQIRSLTFDNIWYKVPNKMRGAGHADYITLLKGISGSFEAGKLTAIMGHNGAGKTSFLNLVLGLAQRGSLTSGDIKLNGSHRNSSAWASQCAYMEQDDHVIPQMTVHEYIWFYVSCRSTSLPSAAIAKRIAKSIQDLQIEKIAETPISMISGGERKRMLIAIEFSIDSEVLILDEPTSGLDSHASFNMFHLLKAHAKQTNKIVIVTIHQPGSGLFEMIDKLYFLHMGYIVYSGPTHRLDAWFTSHDLVIPRSLSKSEFLFELFTGNSVFPEIKESSGKVQQIIEAAEQAADRTVQLADTGRDGTVDYSVNLTHIGNIMGRGLRLSVRGGMNVFKTFFTNLFFIPLFFGMSLTYHYILKTSLATILLKKKVEMSIFDPYTALAQLMKPFGVSDEGLNSLFILHSFKNIFLHLPILFLVAGVFFFFEDTAYIKREISLGTYSFLSHIIAVLLTEVLVSIPVLCLACVSMYAAGYSVILRNGSLLAHLFLLNIIARPIAILFSLLADKGFLNMLSSMVKFIVLGFPFSLHLIERASQDTGGITSKLLMGLVPFNWLNGLVFVHIPFGMDIFMRAKKLILAPLEGVLTEETDVILADGTKLTVDAIRQLVFYQLIKVGTSIDQMENVLLSKLPGSITHYRDELSQYAMEADYSRILLALHSSSFLSPSLDSLLSLHEPVNLFKGALGTGKIPYSAGPWLAVLAWLLVFVLLGTMARLCYAQNRKLTLRRN